MVDSIPLRRLLALRKFAPLAAVDLAEVAVLADNVVETTFAAGEPIAAAGARMVAAHLVLEGRIAAGAEVWEPQQAYGVLEALADRAPAIAAVAAVETRTFQLATRDLREILEDNFGLLRGVLRALAARLAAVDPANLSSPGAPLVASAEPLSLVERLIVLRRHLPFINGRLQALAAVAQSTDERRWSPGDVVLRAGAHADTSIMIVDGSLRIARPGAPIRVCGPGETIGAVETLAGLRHAATVEALTATRALTCKGTTILDVIEDHADLGLAAIAMFAAQLLDHVPAHN